MTRFVGIFDNVVAGLMTTLVASLAAGAAGYWWGQSTERLRYEQQLNAAIEFYGAGLGRLIVEATQDPDADVVVSARAIVGARNDVRTSLSSVSGLLNSEIDELSRQTELFQDLDAAGDEPGAAAAKKRIQEALAVLAKKWPMKQEQIRVEIRKLHAELGLAPINRPGLSPDPLEDLRRMGYSEDPTVRD